MGVNSNRDLYKLTRERSNLVILIKVELKKINQVLKKSDNWAKETLQGETFENYKQNSLKTRKYIQDVSKKLKSIPSSNIDASVYAALNNALNDIKNARLKYENDMSDY